MAVTSAASSEMIATSSILTFDLYQIHINPDVCGVFVHATVFYYELN